MLMRLIYLRKVIKRLPDHLIDKWKGVASDLRDKGETPSLEHIGQFLRKRVKAGFDPDFSNIQKSDFRRSAHERKGIHAEQRDFKKPLKCYVCSEEHRLIDCPTFSSCSIDQKIQHAKEQRLCFSCLNRGHLTVGRCLLSFPLPVAPFRPTTFKCMQRHLHSTKKASCLW